MASGRSRHSWRRSPIAMPARTIPSTWTDYATALAAVQAGHADGISYILTKDDPFGAIDLDHCRCTMTHSIDVWAQNFLDTAVNTYQEITPTGEGFRIWGFADGDPLNRKFTLKIDGKRLRPSCSGARNKALTITGLHARSGDP